MKRINKSHPVTMNLIPEHFIYFYASVSLYKAQTIFSGKHLYSLQVHCTLLTHSNQFISHED